MVTLNAPLFDRRFSNNVFPNIDSRWPQERTQCNSGHTWVFLLDVSGRVLQCFFLWADPCNVCVCLCVCDDSEQRRSHISSVSAPQRPWLLGWWPDADAHLACNRRPESGRSSGHLAVFQPSSFRFLQHDVHHVSRGWWDVAASKQVVFVFSLFVLVLPNEVDMSSPLVYGTPSSRVEGTPRSGVRGTPARQRPDLGSVRKAPQVDLHSEPVSACVCFKTD